MKIKIIIFFSVIFFTSLVLGKEIDEKKLGKKVSKEIESQIKLYRSEEKEKLLKEIADKLAKVSERPEVKYKIKILDVYDINAMSIPGGYIYITRGMLKFVQSNDELAAVLAHEIAHNAKKHVIQQIEKEKKLSQKINLGTIGTTLIAILASKNSLGENISIMVNVANAIGTSIASGYTREFEKEADQLSVKYLIAAGYNPLAALSLMQHLVKLEQQRPEVDYGILQTHPEPEIRLQNIKNVLKNNHIMFSNSIISVSAFFKKVKIKENIYVAIYLGKTKIFLVAYKGEDANISLRAENYTNNINSALNNNEIETNNLKIFKEENDFIVGYVYKGQKKTLIKIYEPDAKFYNKPVEEVAQSIFLAILKELKKGLLENYP